MSVYDKFQATPSSLALRSHPLATADRDKDFDTLTPPVDAKAIEVTDVSNGAVLEILPVGNAAGDYVTYTGVVVGFAPGIRPRRIGPNTTCEVTLHHD